MNSTNFQAWPKWRLRANAVRNGRRYGHRWTSEEAKIAGRKGGLARSKNRDTAEKVRRF